MIPSHTFVVVTGIAANVQARAEFASAIKGVHVRSSPVAIILHTHIVVTSAGSIRK